jgi:uncharacterized protein (DUF58 family)
VEFAEHRLYNPGDSIKNMDWKLFARTDKLFVKRFEEETNLRCQIVIDSSSSMFYPDKGLSKFKFSVMDAACLIQLLKRQRDAFGLTLFSENIDLHTPAKSTITHQKFLLSELENILNNKTKTTQTKISENLHAIANQIHKRSMVIIFSDMMENNKTTEEKEELFSAIQHLKYNKHEVIIFNVHEIKHELNFNFENRPHHFIDIETGVQIKVNPTLIKEEYLQKIQTEKRELELKCAQYKIDWIDAPIENGFNQVLNGWLIKRSTLG